MPRGVAAVAILCTALASCTGSSERATVSASEAASPSTSAGSELATVAHYRDEFCAYGVLEGTGCPRGRIPSVLRRPLTLPTLGAGDPCPVSIDHVVSDRYGPAMGSGSVRAVTPPAFRGVAPFGLFETSLDMHKVLWLFHTKYRGPVLVRGAGLVDGALVGFSLGDGGRPFPELWVPPRADWPADGPWLQLPSEVFFDGPGCYGLQIDTRLGSDVIVMLARRPV